MNFLARLISYVANPVLLVLPVPFLLVYKSTGNVWYAVKWTAFSWMFILFVALFVMFAVFKGIFTDFDVSRREQRPLFFLVTSLTAVLYMVSLFLLHGPRILYMALLGILIGIFAISLINLKVKASIHVATISAFITALSILYGGFFLIFLTFIPVIAWARMRIHRHTLREAVVGGMTGILVTIALYIVLELALHV